MDFYSQIELPIPANHEKSPIRKQEFDQHQSGDQHIQNDGLTGQMLVMTAFGPRMMTPKIQCACGGSHYDCDCRIVFDDDQPPPFIQPDTTGITPVRCFRNGQYELPNESEIPGEVLWTLDYTSSTNYFLFVPPRQYAQGTTWEITGDTENKLIHSFQMIEGRICMFLRHDGLAVTPFDAWIVWSDGVESHTMQIHITGVPS